MQIVIDVKTYMTVGIVAGLPGTMTDEEVRAKIRKIQAANLSGNETYVLFDALYWKVINNHAHGMAADVLREVTEAWDQSMGVADV